VLRLLFKVPHHSLLSKLHFLVLPPNIYDTLVATSAIKYGTDPVMLKACAYNLVPAMESLIVIPVPKAQPLQAKYIYLLSFYFSCTNMMSPRVHEVY